MCSECCKNLSKAQQNRSKSCGSIFPCPPLNPWAPACGGDSGTPSVQQHADNVGKALLAQVWCTSYYDLKAQTKYKATEFLVAVEEENSPHLSILREECRREISRELKEIQVCRAEWKQNYLVPYIWVVPEKKNKKKK